MKISTALVICIILLAAAFTGSGFVAWQLAAKGPMQTEQQVIISSGMSGKQIAEQLYAQGVIADPWLFHVVSRLSGLGQTFKAGAYTFPAGSSMRVVMNKLAFGKSEHISFTLPEGLTAKEISARLLAETSLSGDMPPIAEGEIFPDTYSYKHGTSRQSIVEEMKQRMQTELNTAWMQKAPHVPLYNPQELLILASIVQKETGQVAEINDVASVFVNRLMQNMKLQADPTVIYGLENYDGDLKSADMKNPHPYNTYIHNGLPPTPICSPGRAALQAVANPASTTYLFFVADGKGGHAFSKTYAEHKKNVAAFNTLYRARYGDATKSTP